ncbi:hypothetical protein FH972_026467 [Carpinus fangiana]|uniref:Uncharacterized protein n=1 Tax=Carpinus fangiana TaxID=176857 RepID=A0A5N6L429_9ROSI|nr:hypothetical protein FH972_026467 [Carpinus fangiana]
MALELSIPPCIRDPRHPHHLPPREKPLRIQIEGPLVSVKKLTPEVQWHIDHWNQIFPQEAGPALARLTYERLYGQEPPPGDITIRDEYMGWVVKDKVPLNEIDYYGVTFDHLVPAGDDDPEVLQINIVEMDEDEGEYAHEHLPFKVDPTEYTGKRVLAVPRCCQKRKGTQDRWKINCSVAAREGKEPKGWLK